MRRKMHRWVCATLTVLAVLLDGARPDGRYEQASIYYTEPTLTNVSGSAGIGNGNAGLTELHGGRIVRGQRLLQRSRSPYLLREDLYVERDGELVLEPGVEIRFAPMIGITVRGVITAKVIIRKERKKKEKSVTTDRASRRRALSSLGESVVETIAQLNSLASLEEREQRQRTSDPSSVGTDVLLNP